MDNLHYAEAIAAYTRAFRAFPDPVLLYNRGRAHQARGEFPQALSDLERFRDSASEPVKKRVPLLDQLVEEVRAKVARLTVASNVDGAEIRLDGVVLGTAPMLSPVRVNAGPVTIEVWAKGYREFRQEVVLKGADEVAHIEAELEQLPRTSVLRVRGPQNADVFVDGKHVGKAPADVVVPPGRHRVVVRRPAYETAEATVVVDAGERRSVSLTPEKHSAPITTRWWFWAGIGAVVVAGGATAAALTLEKAPSSGENFEPGHVSGPLVRFR